VLSQVDRRVDLVAAAGKQRLLASKYLSVAFVDKHATATCHRRLPHTRQTDAAAVVVLLLVVVITLDCTAS